MRAIKMLGVVLLCCAALVTVSAQAQTPVVCTWSLTSSEGPPNGSWRIISQACKDSSGKTIGGRTFRVDGNVYSQCTYGAVAGYTVSGNCAPPSYPVFHQIPSSTPSCNSGTYIGSGCANSMTGSPNFGNAVTQVCGAGCPVRYENLGAINGCGIQSPFLNAYCQ